MGYAHLHHLSRPDLHIGRHRHSRYCKHLTAMRILVVLAIVALALAGAAHLATPILNTITRLP